MRTDKKNNDSARRSAPLSQVTQQLYEIGKLPPQSVELEEAAIGALLIEKDAITQVIDILNPEKFYKEGNGRIFGAIKSLHGRSDPIDILTVVNELKRTGELEIVGGAYYISQLTSRVASAANVEFHARIIAQKYIQRELITISSETIRDAYEDTTDVFELLDQAESNLFAVRQSIERGKAVQSVGALANQAKKNYQDRVDSPGGVTGVPSGFTDLDLMTCGFQKTDLIIVAARPAMGKTAFVLSLARNAALDFDRPVAIFSLEMSSPQLVDRLIVSESQVDAHGYKTAKLGNGETDAVWFTITKLEKAPVFIDDTPALSIFELRAKCRRLKAQHDIQMVIVDYLQLMTIGGKDERRPGNREQEISTISRNLKVIAKELDVPVIALSQLSRAVENRADKRPQLSDLRESGAIEQDADMVLFIHRPEYYGFTQDAEGNNTAGVAEIIIAKHRNGAVGQVDLRFIERLSKFVDPSPTNYTPAAIQPNVDFQHESKKNEDPF